MPVAADSSPDGTLVLPRRPQRARTPPSPRSSRRRATADSWYDALVFELRRSGRGLSFQSSYTLVAQHRHHAGLDLLLRRHERHRLLLPGVPARLQPGPRRLPRQAQLGGQPHLGPAAREGRDRSGPRAPRRLAVAAIGQLRSGPPLTLFVGANRSRSRWSPSIGPGQGFDRPSLAPGYTRRARCAAIPTMVRPGGIRTAAGGHLRHSRPWRALRARPAQRRPSRSRSASRGRGSAPPGTSSCGSRPSTSSTARTSAFRPAGLRRLADDEPPLPTLGRIRQTVTSARQIQLGLRLQF